MTADVRAFQIHYDARTRAALDPEFEPLDNSASQRPDWYEYWPIRNYLLEHPLEESAWYGFLSPRFREKTHLAGARVKEFIRGCGDADVVTFSPHPCYAACFLNLFEQADFFYRGLYELSVQFFDLIDPSVRLDRMVTGSRNTVFCNYFFAKPRFWRAWLEVLERLIKESESAASPLRERLNSEFSYRNSDGTTRPVALRVFVMERTVSFLLAASKDFTVRNFPPFEFPLVEMFRDRLGDLIALDALKLAYSATGNPAYLDTFIPSRDRLLEAVFAGAPLPLFSKGGFRGSE